jgi:peptidoglycan hydrolase-like protein with peptidoglycan-binding domain
MKHLHPHTLLMLTLALGASLAAQQSPASSHSEQPPSGTRVTHQRVNTEVQPMTKQVGITPAIIRAAQAKLNLSGLKAGNATGQMNASTRRAIRAFQAKEKLNVTGRLDENTLSHLNIGGTDTFGAAPSDIGRGGKAAGHDIAGGHPIAATQAMGKGIGHFGKKVGEGTKSLAVTSKDKVTGNQGSDKTPDAPRL